jgi:hypothetical protein
VGGDKDDSDDARKVNWDEWGGGAASLNNFQRLRAWPGMDSSCSTRICRRKTPQLYKNYLCDLGKAVVETEMSANTLELCSCITNGCSIANACLDVRASCGLKLGSEKERY